MDKPSIEARDMAKRPPHFQVREDFREILMSKELTLTDHRLFWYLVGIDRYGDHDIQLPTWTQIAKALGVSRPTINASRAKLQRLGIWDFTCGRWSGRNLQGVKAKKSNVKSLDTPLNELDTPLNELDTPLNELDTDPPKALSEKDFQTLTDLKQTKTDLKQTFTDPESAQSAKAENPNPEQNLPSLSARSQSIVPDRSDSISRGAASENDSRSNVVTIPPHRLNPVERFQARFSNGGAPPAPWLTGLRWDSLKPEFLEYLVAQLPRKVFRDVDKITALEAKRWATRAMANEVRYCDVEGLWNQMNEDDWKPGTQSQTDYDAGLSDYGTQHLLEQGYIKPGERWDPVTGEIVSDEVSA